MSKISEQILMHYGMPRRSGRYPWGSGDIPYQHDCDFLGRIEKLKKDGWSETTENIRDTFGMSTGEYRAAKANAKAERKEYYRAKAKSMREDGYNDSEIARSFGMNESSLRSLMNEASITRSRQARTTADLIKKVVDEQGMTDVGKGVENELKISKERLNQALKLLEEEGYPVYSGRFDQLTNPGKKTTQKVICPPGTEHKEIYNLENVHSLFKYTSNDNGETLDVLRYPKSLDSSRVKIRYNEEGGNDKDGIIEIRRGVKDLSLGDSRYSQVRILVDGTHYMKGVAVYSDDMPDGCDIVFNTNKHVGTDKFSVLKPIKDDPDNPFGALIKANGQSYYIDENGQKQLSPINKTREEGDWEEWKDTLPSQFLSKQSLYMAKKQLNLAKADKEAEYDEICSLTNPTIKKYKLQQFADDCDSAAVDLKAAALPGQKYHVIIPINTLKDNEIYAPNYEPGTKVALVRYPHGGTFEIPILTVTHKNKLGESIIGPSSIDAVGITKNVADRLSGADFDGDTVMCIPTHDPMGKVKISSRNGLKGLEGFDPKDAYPEVPGMKYMTEGQTQNEMGKISNLITDMTLSGGATDEELAAAVKHSMVVIDAKKHKLNYKASEIDNNIAGLKAKYQRSYDENGNLHIGGASTVISRAKGEVSVIKRQGQPKINIKGKDYYDPNLPEGAYIYKTADDAEYSVAKIRRSTTEKPNATIKLSKKGDAYAVFDGEEGWIKVKGSASYTDGQRVVADKATEYRMQKSSRMAETQDAFTLISEANTPMERVYATYANDMKALANTARKEMMMTPRLNHTIEAERTYITEVKSLREKLDDALKNNPREREAQRRGNVEVGKRIEDDPTMSGKDKKKIKQLAAEKYRKETGAVKRRDRSIFITDKEWEAIQAGAISENKLKQILDNSDPDRLTELAMPRKYNELSKAQVNRIKSLTASNYSLAEISKKMHVSTATIAKYMKGGSV